MSSLDSNRVPFSGIFSLGNSQKYNNRILQGQHGIRGRGTEINVYVRDTTGVGKLLSSGEVAAWKVEEIKAEITSGVGCITK